MTRVAFVVASVLCLVACAKAGRNEPNPGTDAPDLVADSPASDIDAPVLPPDGNTCATQPCDILAKCGCAAGSACDIDTSDLNGTACRTIFMPVPEGQICANATRCDAGLVCLFGSSGGSICKKYCGIDADCTQPRGQCAINITNMGNPIPGVPSVCSSNCDPTNTAAGGCDLNLKCSLFTAGAKNIVDCAAAGTGVQGTACTADATCAPNFLCTTVGTQACRKICIRGQTGICVGAQTCLGFATPFTIAGVEYGVCN